MLIATGFDCYTASLLLAVRSIIHVSLFVARWFAAIDAFRSSFSYSNFVSFVPSEARFVIDGLLCFLIVGIYASGISIPLSLLILFG